MPESQPNYLTVNANGDTSALFSGGLQLIASQASGFSDPAYGISWIRDPILGGLAGTIITFNQDLPTNRIDLRAYGGNGIRSASIGAVADSTTSKVVADVGGAMVTIIDNNGYSDLGNSRVLALPAPAVDGQEVYYVADATNGVLWHLRYNAASASAYKWEFVGGSPLESSSASNAQTTGGGTLWTSTLTDGTGIVAVALPLAGDYLAAWSVMTGHAAATTTQPGVGVWRPNAGEPNTPSGGYMVTSAYGSGAVHDVSGRSRLTGCVVGNAQMAYLYTATVEIFYQRRLTITPIRVG